MSVDTTDLEGTDVDLDLPTGADGRLRVFVSSSSTNRSAFHIDKTCSYGPQEPREWSLPVLRRLDLDPCSTCTSPLDPEDLAAIDRRRQRERGESDAEL